MTGLVLTRKKNDGKSATHQTSAACRENKRFHVDARGCFPRRDADAEEPARWTKQNCRNFSLGYPRRSRPGRQAAPLVSLSGVRVILGLHSLLRNCLTRRNSATDKGSYYELSAYLISICPGNGLRTRVTGYLHHDTIKKNKFFDEVIL